MTRRILVVDDDAGTLKVLSRLLQHEGFEVDTSETPLDALAKVRAAAPDILLTDQVMGGMTGIELARRSLDLSAAIRCFVMSGHEAPALEEREHVIWVQKPLDVDLLVGLFGDDPRAETPR